MMPATRKPPARKPPRKTPGRAQVFLTPVVELDVGQRCSHGCFVITPSSATVWNFAGIGDPIEAGPGCTQDDVLIHNHFDDDPVSADECQQTCWSIFEEDE